MKQFQAFLRKKFSESESGLLVLSDSALTKNAVCGKPSAQGLPFLSGAWKLNHISVDIETTSFCHFREPNTSLTNYFEQLSEGKFEGGFNSFELNNLDQNGHENGHSRLPPKWITLNIGGTCFMTTKATLKKEPKSFLARLATCQDDIDQVYLRNFYNSLTF